jgi:hypothetical protein
LGFPLVSLIDANLPSVNLVRMRNGGMQAHALGIAGSFRHLLPRVTAGLIGDIALGQ